MPGGWLNRLEYACSALSSSDPDIQAISPRNLDAFISDVFEFTPDTWQSSRDNGNTLAHALARLAYPAAAIPAHAQLLRAMSKAGLDLDAQNHAGRTALHTACFNRRTEYAKALILAGARIDLIDMSGETPLHDACAANSEPCIELLLAQGANPTAPNIRGHMPWQIALARGHSQMAASMLASLERNALRELAVEDDASAPRPTTRPRL